MHWLRVELAESFPDGGEVGVAQVGAQLAVLCLRGTALHWAVLSPDQGEASTTVGLINLEGASITVRRDLTPRVRGMTSEQSWEIRTVSGTELRIVTREHSSSFGDNALNSGAAVMRSAARAAGFEIATPAASESGAP
jgi:hypothetical protein